MIAPKSPGHLVRRSFEKGSGVYATQEPYASLYTEDKIIDACKQIKSIKPDIIWVIFTRL